MSLLSLVFMVSQAFAGYDQGWYRAEFWSGEWPNGFSVAKPNVSVKGRTAADKDLAATVECALPYKANFHPWNGQREASYVTYSRILQLTLKNDYVFTPEDEGAKGIPLKKGEKVEWLIYNAEGYFSVRIHGAEYQASLDLADNLEEVPSDLLQEDQWVQVTCEAGTKAWLFYDDLFKIDADGERKFLDGLWYSGIGSPGVPDYGSARDLTDEEIANGGAN